MNVTDDNITLRITGDRAPHGMDLNALDAFIRHLLSALRDFERHRRGAITRKSGAPETSASAATALRLVRLEPGSAVATLVPLREHSPEAFHVEDPPLARVVLDGLLDTIEQRQELPRAVALSLDEARRACGSDGSFSFSASSHDTEQRTVTVDDQVLREITPRADEPVDVTAVSGRLSKLAESPDQALIRAPDGTEWLCDYGENLASLLATLWRRNVHATGTGRRRSPRRGSFRMDAIESVLDDEQTELFTAEHVPTDVLLERQGITTAQGLDAVGVDELFDDEVEDAYLAAIFGEEE